MNSISDNVWEVLILMEYCRGESQLLGVQSKRRDNVCLPQLGRLLRTVP